MGRDMAEKIGAVAYMECSAKRKESVKEVSKQEKQYGGEQTALSKQILG